MAEQQAGEAAGGGAAEASKAGAGRREGAATAAMLQEMAEELQLRRSRERPGLDDPEADPARWVSGPAVQQRAALCMLPTLLADARSPQRQPASCVLTHPALCHALAATLAAPCCHSQAVPHSWIPAHSPPCPAQMLGQGPLPTFPPAPLPPSPPTNPSPRTRAGRWSRAWWACCPGTAASPSPCCWSGWAAPPCLLSWRRSPARGGKRCSSGSLRTGRSCLTWSTATPSSWRRVGGWGRGRRAVSCSTVVGRAAGGLRGQPHGRLGSQACVRG